MTYKNAQWDNQTQSMILVDCSPEEIADIETRKSAPPTIAQINSEFEQEMTTIKNIYPDSEREGWPQQQLEAQAFKADPMAKTPIIDSMIQVSGESKQDIADGILLKVKTYSEFYGAALGRKRKKIAELG